MKIACPQKSRERQSKTNRDRDGDGPVWDVNRFKLAALYIGIVIVPGS